VGGCDFCAATEKDSVLAVVDSNKVQAVGLTDDLTGGASFEEKFGVWVGGSEVGGLTWGAARGAEGRCPLRSESDGDYLRGPGGGGGEFLWRTVGGTSGRRVR